MSEAPKPKWAYPRTARFDFDTGQAIIYSDAHYWPGTDPTAAFNALVALVAALRPRAIIANGDLIDGARISRHARIAWAREPGVFDEVVETQRRQDQIRAASPRSKRFRTIGNHDIRFDNWLSANADQFEKVKGFRLADHLPEWPESWSIRLNGMVVKHRLRGGIHADWNNVNAAGVSICTGHDHQLGCKPHRNYAGTIWGIRCGTLAVCPNDLPDGGNGPFEYLEDSPVQWAGGFAVLTWHKGLLMRPEFCEIADNGLAYFRGSRVA